MKTAINVEKPAAKFCPAPFKKCNQILRIFGLYGRGHCLKTIKDAQAPFPRNFMKRIFQLFPVTAPLLLLAVFTAAHVRAQCTPPPSGMVGWWKGDGSGADLLAANNGTLVNVAYTNGVVGSAFAFDPENFSYGTYTGLQIADQPAYALTNALTIEGWIRPRGPGYYIFFRGDNRPGLDPYGLSMQGNNTLLFGITDQNGNGAQVTTTVAYNVWTHVAATLDGSTGTMTIYTNGVFAAQTVTTVRPFGALVAGDSPGIGIGNLNDGSNNFPFWGDIDEIALYGRALAVSEITAIYNAGSAGKCQTSFPVNGLVLWNTLGSDTEISNSVYGPNLQKYVGGTWPDVAANTSYGPGVFGNAVGIGPGSYTSQSRVHNLVLNNVAQVINTNRGTIDVWFKQNSTPTPYVNGAIRIFDGAYGFNSGLGFNSLPPPDNLQFELTFGGTTTTVNYDITAANGTWLNLAGVWDIAGINSSTDKLRLYVNGQLVAATTNATWGATVGSQADIAGAQDSGCAGQFLVDDLKVFNRALTASEVIQVYGGGGSFTSGPPAIYNFSPAAATNGAVVAIVGTNFSPTAASNIVYFGAVQASVLSASANSLTVTVPPGATFAPITVTVGGLVAYSVAPFEPTFSGNGEVINSSTFAPGANINNVSTPYAVVIADLDGDGKPDLVVANVEGNSFSIFQNIGSSNSLNAASFAAPLVFPVGSGSDDPTGVTVADVDGDGKPDILVADHNNNFIAIFRNIASGGTLTTNSFAPPVFFTVAADPYRIVVRDLDGDGRADVISVNYSSGTISILRNTGASGSITTNSFAPHVDLVLAGNSSFVAVGDLDGDGKPDLAVADSSGFISLFQNHCTPGNISAGTFAARVDLPAQNGSENVVIGDLDGDGRPELIATAYLPQTMSVYRNLSTPGLLTTNSFAAPVDYGLAGRGHTIALSDISGDGKLDIAEVTELSSELSLFQNIGVGNFTNTSLAARVDFAAGYNAWGVAVGDLDGDGRPDAVFGNQYDNTITIYKNQSPFGTPPPPPVTCTPPPAGVVSWWQGEGNANDLVGGNNGTLSASGASYAVGKVGQGFRFDGTNGYVQIPDADSLKPTSVTLEAWIWLDPSLPVNRGGEQIFFKKNTWSAWFEGYSLLKYTQDNGDGTYSERFQFCVSRTGNQVPINSQTIVQRGVWYHVAAT